MQKFILIFTSFFVFIGCKSTKVPPSEFEGQQIIFGSGGGFTGAYEEFILLDDGRLFKSGIDAVATPLKTLDKKITTQLFSNIQTFGLNKLDYNHPQNMYNFIKIKHGTDSNYIAWSGKPTSEIMAANALFQLINSQVKK